MIHTKMQRLTGRVEERAVVAGLILAGVALRAAWNAARPVVGASGEAANVATAIATGRGVADAYGVGTGATAHFYPLSPGIGGVVYGLLGVRSPPAEIVLACWSIGLTMLTYFIATRTFARLGTPVAARLPALAFGCIAPVYMGQEAVDFRLWDGGITVLLMALLLDRLVALDLRGRHDPGQPVADVAVVGALCAGLLLANAPVGLAACVCAAVMAIRRLTFARMVTMGVVASVLLAVAITPWVIRNERVFHAFIPSRSNAGLELTIGMDPQSLTATDRERRFMQLLEEVHPVYPAGQAAMREAGGEVPYSALLGRQTRAWMAGHPGDSIRLMLLHLRQQWFPEPWQFSTFGQGRMPGMRAWISSAANLLGLMGLAAALWRRRAGWLYLALLLGVLSALTLPFQPVKRYTYLYYPFMIFAAADLLATWWRAWSSRAPRTGITPSR